MPTYAHTVFSSRNVYLCIHTNVCAQILDYTSASDNDYKELKTALGLAKVLCDNVNDGVRQKENTEHLEWLQTHVSFSLLEEKLVFNSQTNFMGSRKLLHHGKFFKVSPYLIM